MGAYVSNFFRERVNSTTSSLVATQASAIPRFYPSNRLYSTTTTYKLEDEDGGDSDYESDPDDDFSDLCNHIYWGHTTQVTQGADLPSFATIVEANQWYW